MTDLNKSLTKDKIDTLVGFSQKANIVVYGADFIEKSRKTRLIICCKTISPNTMKRMKNLNLPLLLSKKPLQNTVHRDNCKAIGITDGQMAEAILKNINDNYIWTNKGEEF